MMKINLKSPTVIFFLIAFGVPWFVWILSNSLDIQESTKIKLLYFGDFCSVGGLVALFMTYSKTGIKQVFKRLLSFNFKSIWWLIAIAIPFIYMAIAFVLGSYYEIGGLGEIAPEKMLVIFTLGGLAMFLTGPLGEEMGWRGFLLPKLLEKFTPFNASLIIGFLWGVWHYPIYVNDIYGSFSTGFIFTTHTMLASIIMTFLFLRTKGNILIPIIYHWLMNVLQFGFMFSFTSTKTTFDPFQNVGELIIVIIICLKYKDEMFKKYDGELLFMNS